MWMFVSEKQKEITYWFLYNYFFYVCVIIIWKMSFVN